MKNYNFLAFSNNIAKEIIFKSTSCVKTETTRTGNEINIFIDNFYVIFKVSFAIFP